jgi:hypothetical protein
MSTGYHDLLLRSLIAFACFVPFCAPGVAASRELMGSSEGAGYHLQLPGSGGTAPYTWKVSQGQLPPGLELDESTGVLSADVLKQRGTFDFRVTLTDATGQSVNEELRIVVAAPRADPVPVLPLEIMTTSLPGAVKGTPYSIWIATRGGIPPLRCSFSGEGPQGLALDTASCRLYGTPSANKDIRFQVVVQDSNTVPARSQKQFALAIQGASGISSWWIVGGVIAFLFVSLIVFAIIDDGKCKGERHPKSQGRLFQMVDAGDGWKKCKKCGWLKQTVENRGYQQQ